MKTIKKKFKIKCRTVLTRILILCLLAISLYQLLDIISSWKERPIETSTMEVPKHKIPFPSVTICPEGFSLWAGLRTFLNGKEFTDEYRTMLPISYREFLYRKMGVAEHLYHDHIDDCFVGEQGSNEKNSRWTLKNVKLKNVVSRYILMIGLCTDYFICFISIWCLSENDS